MTASMKVRVIAWPGRSSRTGTPRAPHYTESLSRIYLRTPRFSKFLHQTCANRAVSLPPTTIPRLTLTGMRLRTRKRDHPSGGREKIGISAPSRSTQSCAGGSILREKISYTLGSRRTAVDLRYTDIKRARFDGAMIGPTSTIPGIYACGRREW